MLEKKELSQHLGNAMSEGAQVLEHGKRGLFSIGLVFAHYGELAAKQAETMLANASKKLKERSCDQSSSYPKTQE
jgi:hypothetical protein